MRYWLNEQDRSKLKRLIVETLGEVRTQQSTRPKKRRPRGTSSPNLFYGQISGGATPGALVTIANINDQTDTIEATYGRKASYPLLPGSFVWAAKAKDDSDWHVMLWGCSDEDRD